MTAQETTNIREDSIRTRELCINISFVGLLEREVVISELMFSPDGFSSDSDFKVQEDSLTFLQTANLGDTMCFTFAPENDNFVEADEAFVLVPATLNSFDYFDPTFDGFSISIIDDDGKYYQGLIDSFGEEGRCMQQLNSDVQMCQQLRLRLDLKIGGVSSI